MQVCLLSMNISAHALICSVFYIKQLFLTLTINSNAVVSVVYRFCNQHSSLDLIGTGLINFPHRISVPTPERCKSLL